MKKKKTLITVGIVAVALLAALLVSFACITNGYIQNRRLFDAIENENVEAVEEAVKRGAFVNTRRHIVASAFPFLGNLVHTNPTPLILACESGNKEIIDILLDNGAKINKIDNVRTVRYTPINAILDNDNENRYEIAIYLLGRGARINNKDVAERVLGQTLFIDVDATKKEVDEGYELFKLVAKSLSDNGDFDWWVRVGGYEKNVAVYCAQYRNEKVIEYLIAYDKANAINQMDNDGTTALIAAAKANNIEIVTLLVGAGASLTAKDNEGKNAYDYAVEKGYGDIAELVMPAN